MARRKKQPGRPSRPLPPRTEVTPEELAKAMFALPAEHERRCLREGPPEYQCGNCGQMVSYPNVLTEAGLCATYAEA